MMNFWMYGWVYNRFDNLREAIEGYVYICDVCVCVCIRAIEYIVNNKVGRCMQFLERCGWKDAALSFKLLIRHVKCIGKY